MNGCWYNTELGTSALLKMGCEGVFRARLTYLSTPGELGEVSNLTGPLLSASDAAAIYTTTAGAANTLVQRPCGYWFRPDQDVAGFYDHRRIVGFALQRREQRAARQPGQVLHDGRCERPAACASRGRSRSGRSIRRRSTACAAWAPPTGAPTSCYAETGKLVSQLAFDNSFDRVLLRLKPSGSAPPQCVAVVNGALEVSSCDVAAASLRWTGAGSSDSVTLTNGASPSCIATRSSPATCLLLRFQYAKPSVTFSSSKANIKTADELVDGTVLATASQCLAVSGTTVTLRPSGSSDCAVLQATYVLDDGVDSGDDD
ncbi:hypothetical protein PINS_up022415 [Pythium insidiosum]|nr:hypothetical protein PINS_up022415 [Pythium insidiosum]